MVYVDNANKPYGRMIMSHMIADTTEELISMAESIGVQKKYIQYPNTPKEHFDICLQSKIKAISFGAVEITKRQLSIIIQKRKTQHNNYE